MEYMEYNDKLEDIANFRRQLRDVLGDVATLRRNQLRSLLRHGPIYEYGRTYWVLYEIDGDEETFNQN